jgi:CRP/FNR family transcriptional regulator, polysaccharide utilization system transcription regulator
MKTILLIEDNKEIRKNTSEILELANYKVITAENGKIGIELAKKESPDLIICDVMMPQLDGFGVLQVLSQNAATASIPFIFLTAKTEKEDIRKGMNLGADDYLIKPYDDMALLDTVLLRLKKNEIVKGEFKKNADGLNEFLVQAKGIKELEDLLINESRTIKVKKKHNIYSKGGFPDYLYFINKGKIKTFKIDKRENEFITGLHNEGDFLGYIDLLEDSKYSDTAVALEDAELCLIRRDDFFTLIYNNRDVANKFIKMLSNSVVEKEDRLLKLAFGSVRKRVAEALLMLHKKYQKEGSEEFTMGISRDDLSGLVGASKENVIRTLSDFKEEGLVKVSASRITLIQLEKLANMKN